MKQLPILDKTFHMIRNVLLTGIFICCCASTFGQSRSLDSLRQELANMPDSLSGQTRINFAWEAFYFKTESDTLKDQAFVQGTYGLKLGESHVDTPLIINSLWFLRHYYFNTDRPELGREKEKEHQFFRAHYGYQIAEEYNWWNGMAGYRFTQLYNTLFVLEDTTGTMELEEVLQASREGQFQVNQTTSEDLSDPNLVHWVRLRLKGKPDSAGTYLFMVGNDSYTWKQIDVFDPIDSANYSIQNTGSHRWPEEKTVKDWRSFFRVNLEASEHKTIYLRLQEPNNITIPPKIFINHMNEPYMNRLAEHSRFNNGIFVGILWVQGVSFLLLFLSVRDRSYFFYVIYILALALLVMTSLYYNQLFPRHGEYKMFLYLIILWLAAFGMLRFTDSYLNLKENLPRGNKIVWVFKAIFAVIGALAIILLAFNYSLSQRFDNELIGNISQLVGNAFVFLIPLGLVLILVMGIVVHRKKYSPARYFLIANIFLTLGVGIPFFLMLFNIRSVTFEVAMLSSQIGVVLQLSFFALGVGHKQKILEQEKRDVLEESLAFQSRANDKLRQADKLKDEFLANTSHELKTPLNGIIGIAEALQAGAAKDDKQQLEENLAVIIHSGRRLNNLVNDLLDFSKLKNYDLQLQRKPLDFSSLTNIVLTISQPLLKNKNIELLADIPEDLPSIWADENRLQQILYNIVGNAIKFTEEGEVRVSALIIDAKANWADDDDPVDGMIKIEVSDTGIGIPHEKQEKIFEQFEQADGSIAREYGGTGLGLSITKKLVELHGGKISVKSVPAEGSTFAFTMPFTREEPESQLLYTGSEHRDISQVYNPQTTLSHEEIAGSKPVRKHKAQGDERSIRILVVDDEPVNQRVMKNLLSLENYTVATAVNGEEALQALENEKFDLVLLDIMMPKMSGFEVCKTIRQKYLPNELPVIMVTAKNQVSDLVAGLENGANDYIAKPFSREELMARINAHVDLFKINSAYGRFVPHEFIKSLGHSSIMDANLGDGVEREYTVLFADIRSYTTLAETMTPKENFDFLIAYLGRLGPVIKKYGGFVNQYYGDGVMALFPEPGQAVKAGIEMQYALRVYNADRISKGRKPIETGVGMHTGNLLLGILGDEKRFDAGVVSDTVNTSARMEGLTKYYGASVLVSADTLMATDHPEQFKYRYLGRVQVKGKKEPVGIYDLYEADSEEIIKLKSKSLELFEQGLRLYYQQDFETAINRFQAVLQIYPNDKAAQLYLKNSEKLEKEGVPENWEGVEMMMSK